ncbi:Modification methylase DpnIIA [compost metagenome]
MLAEVFAKLASKRVNVLLSNSMTDLIRDLYKPYHIDAVQASRAVNSRADKRGKIAEALVRSF